MFLDPGIGKDLGNLGAERWFWKYCTLRMAYLDDTHQSANTPIQLWHCAATICPWKAPTFVPSGHLLWIESCWHPGSSGHQGRHPPGAPSCHNLKALKPFQHTILRCEHGWDVAMLPASPCKDLIFLLKLAALEMPIRWETRFLQISTHLRASLYLSSLLPACSRLTSAPQHRVSCS